jgi:cytidine deaminase
MSGAARPADNDARLIERALAVRGSAFAPYSGFRVGAAVLDERGEVHVGCNVENAAYPLGSCAETAAIAAMIAAGGRNIRAIAIAGGRDDVVSCTPCGGCRQRIAEFADAATRVIVLDGASYARSYGIAELLPGSFQLD